MERTLGYTSKCVETVTAYHEKLDKSMETERKAEHAKTKLQQETAIENRREERTKAADTAEVTYRQTDRVQSSESAQSILEKSAYRSRNSG